MNEPLAPPILPFSATAYRTWRDCRRQFLLRYVLHIPRSDDATGSTSRGDRLHGVLRLLHETGSCSDDAHVREVVAAHGLDENDRDQIQRHRRRCPDDAERGHHEVERFRYRRRTPVFLARARLDAVWVRPGLLDVRDYKTGSRRYDRVADDPGARVQAWVLWPRAQQQGLELRIAYEQLAPDVDEDPEPFTVTPDDAAEVEAELVRAAHALRDERTWNGENDAHVCRFCEFRSVCSHSATPGEPRWPAASLPAP